ncbi:MAG: ABC transporter ATP-binding protein [Gemmatimonadota bacterium]
MGTLRALWPYARPYRGGIALGLGLVVASNTLTVATPYFLKLGIDALEGGASVRTLAMYAGAIVGITLLGGAARFGMRRLLNGISRRIECDLRDDFFAHLLRLSPEFYARTHTGEIVSRATNDIGAVRQVAGPAIMYLVNTVVVGTMALALMIWLDPRLTGIALVPLVLLPPTMFYFGREIHDRFEAIQAQFGRLSTMVQENLAGIRIVKAYRQEASQEAQFEELNRDYLDKNFALARNWGFFHPTLTFLAGLGMVAVVWFGGRAVMSGRMTVGDFVAFGFYLVQMNWPLIALGWVINLFQRGSASMGRILEVLRTEPAIQDPPDPPPLPEARGSIELRKVSFRYPGTERWVLRDIDLRIPAGRTVAIVGATGSGKTTLVRLIPRLYDATEGQVLVDGVDVRAVRVEELRRRVSVVPQEPFLFSETLEWNLAFALHDAPEPEQVRWAAEVAQLAETIEQDFPRGYATELGERGINLSGGQKQRATLARAVARNAPILILDDALSSVDTHTEREILERLRPVWAGRTSVIVSHRVTAVMNADHIVVLEEGRVAEEGRHAELLRRGGVYATLLRRQILEDSLLDPLEQEARREVGEPARE